MLEYYRATNSGKTLFWSWPGAHLVVCGIREQEQWLARYVAEHRATTFALFPDEQALSISAVFANFVLLSCVQTRLLNFLVYSAAVLAELSAPQSAAAAGAATDTAADGAPALTLIALTALERHATCITDCPPVHDTVSCAAEGVVVPVAADTDDRICTLRLLRWRCRYPAKVICLPCVCLIVCLLLTWS